MSLRYELKHFTLKVLIYHVRTYKKIVFLLKNSYLSFIQISDQRTAPLNFSQEIREGRCFSKFLASALGSHPAMPYHAPHLTLQGSTNLYLT